MDRQARLLVTTLVVLSAAAVGCAPRAAEIRLVTPQSGQSSEPATQKTSESATEPPLASAVRPIEPPVRGSFDPGSVNGIDLSEYPVVPWVSPSVRAIYQAGLANGNNPHVFSKLGDCMTETDSFLVSIGEGDYDLGEFSYLREVIDNFAGYPTRGQGWSRDSFANPGLAAARGFNVAGPLDATWADPQWCQSGQSPLACEYSVSQPSFALIMFGTNDVKFLDAAAYDYFLRSLVYETRDRNIVPILSTFPTHPDEPEQSRLFNRIIVKVAADYAVPVANLNLALEPLANHGVDPEDPLRLSLPANGRAADFSEANLQAGFVIRNLVALQALEAVWRVATGQ